MALQGAPVITTAGSHGIVTLDVKPSGIPALRLLQWHSPGLRLECKTQGGATITLSLSELDISHQNLDRLNAGRPSFVDPQLAQAGK